MSASLVERFVRVRLEDGFSAERTEGEALLRVLRGVTVLESALLRFIVRREDRVTIARFSVYDAGQGRVSSGPSQLSEVKSCMLAKLDED